MTVLVVRVVTDPKPCEKATDAEDQVAFQVGEA